MNGLPGGLSLAILSTSTPDLLSGAMQSDFRAHGADLQVWHAAFNQHRQEICDAKSLLYTRLPDAIRRMLEGKVAIHSFEYSRGLVGEGLLSPEDAAQVPPVPQALVRANPVNGRKAFFVASHACEIAGMPTDEARALIRDLLDRATAPELVYTHRWRPGDLVVWDNRCVLHRGRPWNESRYRRVMHRTTVAGDGPTAAEVSDIKVAPARASDVAWCRAQLEAMV